MLTSDSHSSGPRDERGDDARLLARLRRGEAEAFEALVRSHMPRLLAVARRLLRNEEDAKDAVQEAFISAFRSLHSFEGNCLLSTWLHRVAVNAALMKLRSRRRQPEERSEAPLPSSLAAGGDASDPPEW